MTEVANAPPSELTSHLERLRAAHLREPIPDLRTRTGWLDALESALQTNAQALIEAVSADFGHRSPHETRLGDLWLSLTQIRHLRARLPSWIEPKRVSPLWVLRPARAAIHYQPRGVVGIIAPWNYPIMLALSPLAGALAAGNRVLLKLSEHTPRTSQLLADTVGQALPDVVQVVLGGAEVGSALARLPLDHLLFTGSHGVGKRVAQAAAENLVPVTLELGGKSPAILHESYPVEAFAARLISGKCFNAGQSCVAPDYALVPRSLQSAVARACERRVAELYPTLRDNPDYTALASEARKQRLLELQADAVARGARALSCNPAAESFDGTQKLAPVLLLDVPEGALVLEEELFGPLLPIVPYDDLSDALSYVNQRPKPLAVYYFDDDSKRVQHVLARVRAGGVTVNDTLLHFLCDELPREPFGESGHGAYSGRSSFETFSHKKSVFYQAKVNPVEGFSPPYGRWVNWVLQNVLAVRGH